MFYKKGKNLKIFEIFIGLREPQTDNAYVFRLLEYN